MATTLDPELLGRALALAAELHAGQVRKGTSIPYLSHLMAVSALTAEDGGSETAVVAALLHDAAEDQGGEATLQRIADVLGASVSGVVRECSDAVPEPGAAKAPWRERKLTMIAAIPGLSRDAIAIVAADKLHNVRSTLADVELGIDVWDRFKTGREGFLWYHAEVLGALGMTSPSSRSVRLLGSALDELARSSL